MTRKELLQIQRALEFTRDETGRLSKLMDDDLPEIAAHADAAREEVLEALLLLESAIDDVEAIVPDEADRIV